MTVRDDTRRAFGVAIGRAEVPRVLALADPATVPGIAGHVVRVEADGAPGTRGFDIIGLPDGTRYISTCSTGCNGKDKDPCGLFG